MRECPKCNTEKPLEEFYLKKSKISSWCKDCCRKAARNFYKKNPDPYRKRARIFNKKKSKERMIEANRIKLETGCQYCGEKALCVLDFHHLIGNSKGKDGGVPVVRAAHNSDAAFYRELIKCVVLCANCHRKAHAGYITLPEDIKRCTTNKPKSLAA